MVLYMTMESGVTLLLNKLKPQCFVPKLVEIGPVLLEKISKSRQCIFTIFSYLPLEQKTTILVFVCLEFIIPLENFSLIWTHHHCRWRAANIVLCSALMAIMSSEGSLTCHTHCNTGLPFVMVISEDPWHSHLMQSVCQWSCHYLLLQLRSVATGDRTPISRMRGKRSTSTPPWGFQKLPELFCQQHNLSNKQMVCLFVCLSGFMSFPR